MRNIFTLTVLLVSVLSVNGQNKGDLKVRIEGLRNNNGKLSITLFNSPAGFPEDIDRAYKWKTIDLEEQAPVFLFNDLPRGDYAYAILHDEDGNGKMNKNILGIPREGFGFSNNYVPKIKNPSFSDASFSLKEGSTEHEIEIQYF